MSRDGGAMHFCVHPTKLAYSVGEAAAQVSYSVETIRLAMRHGDLRASYANTKPVIRAAELQRWLDSLPTDEPPRRSI